MQRRHSHCMIAFLDRFRDLRIEYSPIVHLIDLQEMEETVKVIDAILPGIMDCLRT